MPRAKTERLLTEFHAPTPAGERAGAHSLQAHPRSTAMNFKSLALPLALALAAAGCASGGGKDMLAADAPRALPESGPVSVRWNDPATFTELRYSRNRWESERGPWLTDLAEYLRKRAATQLPDGERLELTIVDVDRAGDFEPWLGMRHQDTRIVRDIYPPRMTLQVRHFDASGALISEGETPAD